MNLNVAVCLPRDAETVAIVRSVVGHALSALGVTAECVADIQVALSEACTNVIDHASVDDDYEVELSVDEDLCSISVRNAGNGFDAASLHGVMPDPLSARGRGVAIMRAVVDNVSFTSEAEAGTIVRLVKRLSVVPHAPLSRLGHSRRPGQSGPSGSQS